MHQLNSHRHVRNGLPYSRRRVHHEVPCKSCYTYSLRYILTYLYSLSQVSSCLTLRMVHPLKLILGHEVVGTISAIGKDVKGFELGDRCVADPGVTVSSQPLIWVAIINLNRPSVKTASTAVEAGVFYAKTSSAEGSAWLVDLLNLSSCKSLTISLRECPPLTDRYPARGRRFIRSTT